MTIDEAIKHEEEIAIQQLEKANALDNIPLFGMSKDDIEEIKEWYRCSKEHEQLAEWLKELKQLKEQTRWIPVSERLPEIHNYMQEYIVTIKGNFIRTAFFTETNGRSWWSIDDVTAWMPLPEPYKASPTGAERSDKK